MFGNNKSSAATIRITAVKDPGFPRLEASTSKGLRQPIRSNLATFLQKLYEIEVEFFVPKCHILSISN